MNPAEGQQTQTVPPVTPAAPQPASGEARRGMFGSVLNKIGIEVAAQKPTAVNSSEVPVQSQNVSPQTSEAIPPVPTTQPEPLMTDQVSLGGITAEQAPAQPASPNPGEPEIKTVSGDPVMPVASADGNMNAGGATSQEMPIQSVPTTEPVSPAPQLPEEEPKVYNTVEPTVTASPQPVTENPQPAAPEVPKVVPLSVLEKKILEANPTAFIGPDGHIKRDEITQKITDPVILDGLAKSDPKIANFWNDAKTLGLDSDKGFIEAGVTSLYSSDSEPTLAA